MDRFHHHLKIMKDNNCVIPQEQELVGLFIMKLREDTYGEFKNRADNEYRRHPEIYPTTIIEAYRNAQHFCPMNDKQARVLSQAERLTTKYGYDPASAYQAGVDLSDSVDPDYDYHRSSSSRSSKSPGKWAPTSPKDKVCGACAYCHKDGIVAYHWHRDCPKVSLLLKNARAPSVVAEEHQAKQRKAMGLHPSSTRKRKVTYMIQSDDPLESDSKDSNNDATDLSEGENNHSDQDQSEF
jgi:hypothetical protein